MPVATLDNRGMISIAGDEAEDFLQNIVTTDLKLVTAGEIWPGALLTPQGKILFEFLIGRTLDGFVVELPDDQADALIRRLMLYRLRAKVEIARLPVASVRVAWGENDETGGMIDQRFARAGQHVVRTPQTGQPEAVADYRAMRIGQGISGGGEDGPLGDYFPHDLLMDRNGGLSFRKGCYVGQEVVSRMQHRSTARRRLVVVSALTPLATGQSLTVDGREIGSLIATEGRSGLAVARIDKAGAAMAEARPILVDGQPVTLVLPAWSGLTFPVEADEAAS